MHKARKEIEEAIPQVDVIIEVLDARIPFSSENPLISDIGNGLQLAKSIVDKGELSIGDAAEKVLNLKGEGKDWMQIAKDFDVDVPDFSAGDAMEKIKKLSTE